MKKNLNINPKPKKINNTNKLKKVLYPSNVKPITLEMKTGYNRHTITKNTQNNQNKKNKKAEQSHSINCRNLKKNVSQKENQTLNKSQNNNTVFELDYLNFSRIDIGLYKPNSSFDDDIFGSPNFKKDKKRLVSERYNGIESSIDTIKSETHNSNNNNYIDISKEEILKTPSTICNYYGESEAASSSKKGDQNFDEKKNLKKIFDEAYINKMNEDIKYINVNTKKQNVLNWKIKDSIKVTKDKEQQDKKNKDSSNLKKDKLSYKNNLMENYLNSKIKKRRSSVNISTTKKNYINNELWSLQKEFVAKTLKYNNISTKSINIQNNEGGSSNTNVTKNKNNNTNSTINSNYTNKTITGVLINTKDDSKSNIVQSNNNNNTNPIYYNQNGNNRKKQKNSIQQRPIILCYDQMKYDSYFVTPKNNNKLAKGKVLTSNKSSKLGSTSGGLGGTSTNKNSQKGNKNTNDKKTNNNSNNNYELIVNTLSKMKTKSFNQNKLNNIFNTNNINQNNPNSKINLNNDYIKINLKNHNKSSSSLIRPKDLVSKDKNNSNIDNILKIIKSGGKENSQFLQNLINRMNNSNTKSPLKKFKSNNALKISKTLTEQNILNRMQVTPKYNKIPKNENNYNTTLVKKNIYAENLNNMKYYNNFNSSIKKNCKFIKSNNKNDILSNLFNHKTQSDFKTNKYYLSNKSNQANKYDKNNNDYGLDTRVKQKLLDRMNNAIGNGWKYFFRGNNNNNNKKVLMENLSEIMKSPEKKEFNDNHTIISNESLDENDIKINK